MTARSRPGPGAPVAGSAAPVVELHGASTGHGDRTLWSDLDLSVRPGEFVAVLGANGSGKTSLFRVLLGRQPLRSGDVRIFGAPVRRGSSRIGYVPQRSSVEEAGDIRARDLVRMGADGHRFGTSWLVPRSRRDTSRAVDAALEWVGATSFANASVGVLSGGEFQRVRIAQALVSDPELLLCDEPLTALDVRRQQEVAALIDRRRRESGTAVLFITHEINAVLPYADQVLYLANGGFRIGPPDEVITTASLSELYGSPVEVIRSGDRVVILASATDDHDAYPGEVLT